MLQANSLIPPPYSSAPGSVEQINSQTSPPTEVSFNNTKFVLRQKKKIVINHVFISCKH